MSNIPSPIIRGLCLVAGYLVFALYSLAYAQPTMSGFEDEWSLDRLLTHDLLADQWHLESRIKKDYLNDEWALNSRIEQQNNKKTPNAKRITNAAKNKLPPLKKGPISTNVGSNAGSVQTTQRQKAERQTSGTAGEELLRDVLNVVIYKRQSRELAQESEGLLDPLKMIGRTLRKRVQIDNARIRYDELSSN